MIATRPVRGRLAVSYGYDRLPARNEPAEGGIVKFQRLAEQVPPEPRRFSVLYLGSSKLPPDWRQLLWLAQLRDAAIVWNQDGVAYPAWLPRGWERLNARMARGLHAADYVFFQSEFCRLSADRFLGARSGEWEILHNAVDTRLFAPPPRRRRPDRPVLVLGGNQYHWYRVESGLRAASAVAEAGVDVRVLITGDLSFSGGRERTAALARVLGLGERVELLGRYVQADAPAVYGRGDLLLHTKVMDPCPGTVIEAMACGLPVVHPASGGVPELVGEEGGCGVESPTDWDLVVPPDPAALAAAVLQILDRYEDFSAGARERAVRLFDLAPWIERHLEVFERLRPAGAAR